MRSGANEPIRIGSITDDDFVDQIFEPSASRSDSRNKRDIIQKALLNEIVE